MVFLSPGRRVATAATSRETTPRVTGLVESVTSELVLIETYVTDLAGRPVRGLTKDDFRLEVNGLKRTIASAEFHELESSAGSLPPAVDGAASAGPVPPVAPAWPRRFLLFFEDNTSHALGLTEVRKAAMKFLEHGLSPGDEVALAAYDERLHFLQDFTTDRAVLRSALERSLTDSERFSNFDQEAEQLYQEITSADPRQVQVVCDTEKKRLAGALKAAETLSQSLAGWKGYKALVYMGEGVAESPMEDAWRWLQRLTERYPSQMPPLFDMSCTLNDELKSLERVASAAGVTFDTIQTAGLTAASIAGKGFPDKMQMRRSNALQMLALNTGGTYAASNDFVQAFRNIEQESAAYYLLGYVPVEPADGRYRHIVVRCRRKDLHLRFRHGFARLPPEEARARALQSAFLFPELVPDAGLELTTVEGPSAGGDRVVDLVLRVPLDRLPFLPEAGDLVTRFTVAFVGLDARRSKTCEGSRAVVVRRGGDGPGIDDANLYARVTLPAVEQSITAVLSDDRAGVLGAVKAPLAARAAIPSSVLGLSIYNPSRHGYWVEVPVGVAGHGSPSPASPERVGPSLVTSFHPGEPMAVGFRFAPATNPAPDAYRVEIRSGQDVARSRSVDLHPGDAAGPLTLDLPAGGLAAGTYDVSVVALFGDREVDAGRTTLRIVDASDSLAP